MSVKREQPIKRPRPGLLRPFPAIVEKALHRGWKTELHWEARGWLFDIFDGEDLLVRVCSQKATPDAFRDLGSQAATVLAKQRRL